MLRYIAIGEVIGMQRLTINVGGMNCYSCGNRIENALRRQRGVNHAKVDFYRETVLIEFDPDCCNAQELHKAIRDLGYSIPKLTAKRSYVRGLTVAAFLLLLFFYLSSASLTSILPQQATYLTLFLVGLLSSLHCAGMCGGIALAQNASHWLDNELKPTLLYNLGRVMSYTLLGGIIGAAGSVLDFSPALMAAITILAGFITVLIGTNMLGIPLVRRLLSILPSRRLKHRPQNPFIIGLLNGLMPCGPLQAMQVYALGMGNFAAGAFAMFSFALGTVPMMAGLGIFIQKFSSRYTGKLFKISATIVVILGLTMMNRGLTIGGIEYTSFKVPSIVRDEAWGQESKTSVAESTVALIANQQGFSPLTLYAKANNSVRIVITAQELNGCNNIFMIPSLNIKRSLVLGENIISIPPQDKDLLFSCGMGMIKGKIHFTK